MVALAYSVTTVPEVKEALQVDPQLIPDGELVTVPEPVPFVVTLKLYEPGEFTASWTLHELDSVPDVPVMLMV